MEELDQVEDDFAEDGLGDEAAGDGFDLERGRRSLASIFDSDEDSVLEVDSAQQDESLLVRPRLLPWTQWQGRCQVRQRTAVYRKVQAAAAAHMLEVTTGHLICIKHTQQQSC